MKIISIFLIIAVAVVMLFGSLGAFIGQTDAYMNATATDGYTFISEVSGGWPTILIGALIFIALGAIFLIFRR